MWRAAADQLSDCGKKGCALITLRAGKLLRRTLAEPFGGGRWRSTA
jgi:hypothetical protein